MYKTANAYYKEKYGCKVYKLSLDGGFTCPNRDGKLGVGGCIFCSGSAEFAEGGTDISKQLEKAKHRVAAKNKDGKYIAYFQSFTNTYAPVERLRKLYYEAIAPEDIVGLAIGTRPDCLGEEVMAVLKEIHAIKPVTVELGLQTIHEDTAVWMNRGYELAVYDYAIKALIDRGIKTVVHLILGLPGETKQDMIDSVNYVTGSGTWGMKIHMLNVVKGSRMEKDYADYNSFESIEEYVNFVCDLLEIIPPEIVMHRLSADAPRKILITPEWSFRKRTILNGIQHELKRRGSYQGCNCK